MRTYGFSCACLSLGLSALSGAAQGTYQNLDFEQAQIVPGPPLAGVVASNALPGWTVYYNGADAWRYVDYDVIASYTPPGVSLYDGSGAYVLDGKYSVVLQGTSLSGGNRVGLGQAGTIPSDAESLRFLGLPQDFALVSVSFAGHPVPVSVIGEGPAARSIVYAGDIAAFAGQTGELLFTAASFGACPLDDISFSPLPLPEPSVFAIAGLGVLLLGWRLSRKRKAHRHAARPPP